MGGEGGGGGGAGGLDGEYLTTRDQDAICLSSIFISSI